MTSCALKNSLRVIVISMLVFLSSVSYGQAPIITSQPTHDTTCSGNAAYFKITATNATSYQWQVNTGSSWSNVSNGGVYGGATTDSLYITAATASMGGNLYRCRVTNSGTVSSSVRVLYVSGITSTTGDTVCAGTTAQLTAAATNVTALVNWYTTSSGGTVVDTGTTLSISNPTATTTYYAEAVGYSSGSGSPTSLATPYNSNNGQRGAMFDVRAGSSPITITDISANLYASTTAYYEMYYRPSTHVGFENSSTGWVFLDSASGVASLGNNVATPLPFNFSVTIPANTTYSFYLTNDFGGGTSYTDGTAVGNTLSSNSDLTIYEGVGKGYPFGLTYTVRNINATLFYYTGSGSCVSSIRTATTLIVNANSSITNNPSNSSISGGNNTSFTIAASNATTYQWQVSTNSGSTWSNVTNGGVYSNATTTTLNLTSVPGSYNGYQYRSIASNSSGCGDTSTAATLSVSGGTPPSITTQPAASTTCAGSNTSFSITASNATSYQWLVSTNGGSSFSTVSNGGVYSGATTSTLSITAATTTYNSYQYKCIATGSASPADTSDAVALTVTALPTITSVTNDTVCAGNSGALTASASTGANVRWYAASSGGSILHTGDTLNITNPGSTTTYYAEITSTTDSLKKNNTVGTYRPGVMFDIVPTLNLTITSISAYLTHTGLKNYEIWYKSGTYVGNVTNQSAWTLLDTFNNMSAGTQSVAVPLQLSTPLTLSANTRYAFYITNRDPYNVTADLYVGPSTISAGDTSASNNDIVLFAGTNVGQLLGSHKFTPFFSYYFDPNVIFHYYTGTGCSSTSRTAATLTVNPNANITTNPSNSTITTGNNTSFGIAATNATTYQWQVSTNSGSTWSNISNGGVYTNATTTTLNLTSVPNTYGGYQYRCVASNSGGCTDTSTVATLTVSGTPPSVTAQPAASAICAGSNTSFSITASNATSYQWLVSTNGGSSFSTLSNGGVYNGATTSTLSITAATTAYNTYQYKCIASGSASPADTSDVASLSVTALPTVSSVTNDTVCSGNNGLLTASASAGAVVEWYDSSTGGSLQYVGDSLSIPSATNTVTYYAGATTSQSLATPYTGGNSHNGVMFDVRANNTLIVSHFAVNVIGTSNYEIFYRAGTHVGHQNNSSSWTSLGTATGVAGAGTNTPTLLPIYFSLTIPANSTYSFYITSTVASQFLEYSNGTLVGDTLSSNSDIVIYEGVGKEYPFGTTYSTRNANVTLYYGTGCNSASRTAATLTVDPNASITTNPSNSTITTGNNTSFGIAATNATTYQWQVSTNSGSTWTNISNGGVYTNATTTTLNLSSVPNTYGGYQYRCIASNSGGCSDTSNAATLSVSGTTTAITIHPSDDTTCQSVPISFTVSAVGTSLTYQWQASTNGGSSWLNMVNSSTQSGVTTNTVTLNSPLTSYNGYMYRCVVSGSVGNATSNPATLTVDTPPNTIAQPANSTICTGTNTSFSITAVGTDITYQWQVSSNSGSSWSNISNGGIYSNATTNTLSITGATSTQNGYQYRCVVNGKCTPSATSNAGTLTVNPAPAITTQPVNRNIAVNSNTNFSVFTTAAFSFQWQVSTNSGSTWSNVTNGGVYSGATNAGLILTSVPLSMNGYQFRCIATGGCSPAVTSNAATLTVTGSAPSITTQPSNSTICPGNTSFSVAATGTSLTYQWEVSTNSGSSWSNVSNTGIYSGVTTSTLILTGANTTYSSYRYRCVVTGSVSPATTSNSATLTIDSSFTTSLGHTNPEICLGADTSFTAYSAGSSNYSYQWKVSTNYGSSFSNVTNAGFYGGATAQTLTLTTPPVTANAYFYFCTVTNGCAVSVNTDTGFISIYTLPSVSGHPANSTIGAGSNTTFTVTASASSITYQWQVSTNGGSTWSNVTNTGIYSGATTNALSLTSVSASYNTYQYRCVVSGICTPSATSNVATLTVNSAPAITAQPANSTICNGANTTFSVTATNATAYQWQESTNGGSTWSNLSNTGIYSNVTTSTLTLTAVTTSINGNQYRCEVTGLTSPNAISNTATLSIDTAPSITAQPSNSTICATNNTTFSVTATGAGLAYQWQVSTNGGSTWGNLSNTGIYSNVATNTLSLTNATTAVNNNQYRCVVSGTCTPPATSNAATLMISTAPSVTAQPGNSTICSGANTTFSITATGTAVTYQWQVSTNSGSTWSNVTNTGIYSGTTTSTLSLTAAASTVNAYQYRCVVNGTCSPSATSNAATITINTAPAITLQPANATTCDGSNATFNVAATGAGLTYQWQESTNGGSTWSNLSNTGIYSNVTTNALALTGATSSVNNYQYRCVVSGTCTPSATSSAATLTINSTLSITTQPVNSTICSGNSATFTVVASASGLTYQWQESTNGGSTWSNLLNTGIYSGVTTSSLTLTGATTGANNNQYRCVLSSTCTAPSNSNAAVLTVNTAPSITAQPNNSTICEHTNTSFSVTASGTGLTYQWEVNDGSTWSNVTNTGIYSGATTNTLTLTAATTAVDGYQYRCVVGGTCVPGVNSNAVILSINTAPVITAQAVNSTICAGNNTSFSIIATGTLLTYQWEVSTNGGSTWSNVTNTGIYTGANTATLALASAPASVNNNQYRCVVSGQCTPSVTGSLVTITVNTAPSVTAQPANRTICENTNTTFSVMASGTGLTYQWEVNDGSTWSTVTNTGIYSGATTNTLTLTSATTAVDGYQYRCVIGGSCVPGVNSNAASLTINTAPVITMQPANSTICETDNTSFSVTATGTLLNYQWQLSTNGGSTWTNVTNTGIYTGANSATLALAGATTAVHNNQYRCVVSGLCLPAATSNAATLMINTAPAVTTQPVNSTICSGNNTVFSIAATGTNITYQWQVNNGSGWGNVTNAGIYAGATTNTLSLTGATTIQHTYQYRCVVSGTCTPQATSNAATLTINTSPVVTAQPVNRTICETTNTTFSIAATGAGLTYQWEVNDGTSWSNVTNTGIYAGATTSTLTLIGVSTAIDGYQYRCQVNGTCTPGTVSNAATITINTAPLVTNQPNNSAICSGNNTMFSITATGTNIGYQWQVYNGSSWSNVSNTGIYTGATTNSLTLTGATTTVHNYQYRCVVSGTCTPQATSNAVTLTIYTAPAITTQPASSTICENTNTTFTVTATGAALTYQWQVNNGTGWSNVTNTGIYSGAASSILTLTAATTAEHNYQYRCVISGTCPPNVTTSAATLSIQTAPVVTTQPANDTTCEGSNASFNISATGTNVNYQWQVSSNGGASWSSVSNTGIYSGAMSNTLTLTAATTAVHNYQYRCYVTGTCAPPATSQAATMTIYTLPQVTTQPTSQILCEGDNTTYSIMATGTGISYQWQYSYGSVWTNLTNTAPFSGVNSNTLSITSAPAWVSGASYRCVVSGACTPAAVSGAGSITIRTAPVITYHPVNDTVCEGLTASFVASATGSGVTYQWQQSSNGGGTWSNLSNGGLYSGAITNVLTIANVPPSYHGYRYRCLVGGVCPPVQVTNAAELTVNTNVAITSVPPSALTLCSGDSTTLTVGATGSGLSYQWNIYSGGVFVPVSNSGIYSGANSATLHINGITAVSTTKQYIYYCSVSGTCSGAQGGTTTITVNALPTITAQPSNVTVCDSTPNTGFVISATGTGHGFQWQINTGSSWTNLSNNSTYSGATTANIVISRALYAMNGNRYRCIVSGTCAPADTSVAVALTVNPLKRPEVTISASDTDICDGNSVTFTASPVNGGNATYQWVLNGTVVGTNSSTYTTSTLADVDVVTCVMTSGIACPSPAMVISNAITMQVTQNVTPAVSITSDVGASWCTGKPNVFRSMAVNEGASPTYKWMINGNTVGSNADTLWVAALNDGDKVQLEMASGHKCPVPPVVTSNEIEMDIFQTTRSSIVINANPDSVICDQSQVTMYSAFTNGGITPAWQWMLNGKDIAGATGGTLKISSLKNGDTLHCRFISSNRCVFPEVSNGISFAVEPLLEPKVAISVYYIGDNKYTFTALPTLAGSKPKYIWHRNNSVVTGQNGPQLTLSNVEKWEKIWVELASSEECLADGYQVVSSRIMTTGVANTEEEYTTLNLYPNPNNGMFTITGRLDQVQNTLVDVSVFNTIGQEIYKEQIEVKGGALDHKLQMTDIVPGGYMLKLEYDGQQSYRRFIITK